MAEKNPKTQGEEVKLEGAVFVDEASPKIKLTFDFTARMRALHGDPSQRVEDESTMTHHMS